MNLEAMKEHFKYRTGYHLWCVRKWSDRIAALNDERIDRVLLDLERDDHDEGKWTAPEYEPYLYISWNYKCKREGVPFDLPQDIHIQMREATFHHVKRHKHHPECWDESATIDVLNPSDRDKPAKPVDASKMPLTYVAAMVADWMAMSEELGGHPKDWADKNANVRWHFTFQQTQLIYEGWLGLYGEEWVNQEIRQAYVWCTANPGRKPKSNYSRFLNNWLQRGWERHRKTLPSNKIAPSWIDNMKLED